MHGLGRERYLGAEAEGQLQQSWLQPELERCAQRADLLRALISRCSARVHNGDRHVEALQAGQPQQRPAEVGDGRTHVIKAVHEQRREAGGQAEAVRGGADVGDALEGEGAEAGEAGDAGEVQLRVRLDLPAVPA